MKSTLVSSEGIKKILKIEVDAETVSSAFEAELKKVGKKVTLPGFRKGKAPMSAVRASYGKSVIPDVIESLVNKNYFLALKEHDLHPVSSPHIDFENIVDGQGFVFSAQVETKPNISLTKYKSFNFKKETPSIEDSQVQSTLNKILESSR